MARWKVTAKHYIHGEQFGQPTEWERQEMNTATGRMFRKTLRVPMYIDPEDPVCINKSEGFCVVALRGGFAHPGDIIIEGPPTPDMEPLDEEAFKITEAEKPKWKNPIDGLEPTIGEDFGKRLLDMFERQLDMAGVKNTSLKGASSSDVEDLKKIVAQQQEMINKLMGNAVPPKHSDDPMIDEATIERVVDDGVKLDDVDPNAPPAPPPITINRPRNSLGR